MKYIFNLKIISIIIFLSFCNLKAANNEPFTGEAEAYDSAGVDIPYGFMYSFVGSIREADLFTKVDDEKITPLNFGFYYDTYQFNIFSNMFGKGINLLFRSTGRDDASGFKIGWYEYKNTSDQVLFIGYESSGGLSSSTSFSFYQNYSIGASFEGFNKGFYMDLQIGVCLRIPFDCFALRLMGVLNSFTFTTDNTSKTIVNDEPNYYDNPDGMKYLKFIASFNFNL